ncbi:VWFC domain [Trinorchestia longiramus]|nr:VWFC domain [Trinorchestia longiramus]
MQECILKVEGCTPVFQEGICCPVRYRCEGDKPLFPQIGGPEVSDSYATVVYQPKYTTTASTSSDTPSGTTTGTPSDITAVPDTTTGKPFAGTTSSSATESQTQTDDPEMQFFTGSGARRSKAHEDDDYLLTTTQQSAEINATTGLPITTMIPGAGTAVCVYQDEIYADGASISTDDPCQHCYCMNGDLVCAIHECRSSLDEAEEGCVPRPPLPGQCCPEGYDCPDQIETSSMFPDVSTDFTSAIPVASTDEPEPEKHEGSEPTTASPTVSDDSSHHYGPVSTDEDSVPTRITPDETSQTDPVGEAESPEAVTTFTTDTELSSSSTPLPTADEEEKIKDTAAPEDSETITKSPEEVSATDDTLSTAEPLLVDTSSTITPLQESGVTDSSVSSTVKETDTTEKPAEVLVTEKDSASSPQPSSEIGEETLGESKSTTSPDTEVSTETATVSKVPSESITSPDTEVSTETVTVSKDPSESITSPDTEVSTETATVSKDPSENPSESTTSPDTEVSTETVTVSKDPSESITSPDTEVSTETATVSKDPSESITSPDTEVSTETATVSKDPSESITSPDTEVSTETATVSKGPSEIATSLDTEVSTETATVSKEPSESITSPDTEVSTETATVSKDPSESITSPDTEVSTETATVSKDPSESITSPDTEVSTETATVSKDPSEIATSLDTEVSTETATVSKDPSESSTSTPSSEKPIDISETETESSLEPAEEKEPVEGSPDTPTLPEVTTPGIPGEGDCMMNGVTFFDGEVVPTSSACEESCTCRDSVVVCKFKSCSPPPPSFLRCTPAEISGECCPRYDCPEPQANSTCEKDGIIYEDGTTIPDDNACNECFCTEGKIICAVRECVPPPKGCVASPRLGDSCCPTEYECPSTAPDVGDLVMATEKPSTDEAYGKTCTENGKVYKDGTLIPPTNICHLTCACKNGDVRCIQKACPPPPPAFLRCLKIDDATQCCPSYECPPPAVDAESTCRFNGVDYSDSELVPSYNKCEECRCIEGEVICAELECIPPGPNCVPTQEGEEMCCPTSYDCSNVTEVETPTSPVFSSVTDEDKFTGSPILPEIGKITPDDFTDSVTAKTPESDVTATEISITSKVTTIGPIETTSFSQPSVTPEIIPEDAAETVTDKIPESEVTSSVDSTTPKAAETFTSPEMIDTTRIQQQPSDSDTPEDITDGFTTKTPEAPEAPVDDLTSATATTPKSIEATTFPYTASEHEVTPGSTDASITAKIPETEVTAPGDSTASEVSEIATTPGPSEATSASHESSEPDMQADSTAYEDPKLTYGVVTEQSVTIDEDDDKTTPLAKDQAVTDAPYSEITETDPKPEDIEDSANASLTTETVPRTSEVTKPDESQGEDTATTVDSEFTGSTKTPLTTVSETKVSTTDIDLSEIGTTEASFPPEEQKEIIFPETGDSPTADSTTPQKELSSESALTTETPLKLEISTESKYSSPDDITSSVKDTVSYHESTESTLTDGSTSSVASLEPTEVTETTLIHEKEDETHEDTIYSDGQTESTVITDRITTPFKDYETTADLEVKPEKESTEIPRATDEVMTETVTTSDIATQTSISTDAVSTTLVPEGPSDPEVTTAKQEREPTSTDPTSTAKPIQEDIRYTDALPDIGDSTLYKAPPKETSAPEVDSSTFSTTTEIISTYKPAVTSSDVVTSTEKEHKEGITDETSESPEELSTAMPTKISNDDTSVTSSTDATKTDPSQETDLSTSTPSSKDPSEIATETPSVEYVSEIDSSTLSPASQPVTIATGTDHEPETTESVSKTSIPDLFKDTCIVEGVTYFDGEVILSLSFQKCQGKCICNKTLVECSKPACPPPPPQHLNCEAVNKPQQCCPSYTCDNISPGGDPSLTCEQYGKTYNNGQYVPTAFECSDCYCVDSEVICEKIKCQQPIGNCTPLEILPGKCCPSEYKCTEPKPAPAQTTTPATTDDELLQPTTLSSEEESQSCIKDGITYMNGKSVPISNSCQESCKCNSGTVQCKLQACPPSPPAFLRCVAQEKPDQCCPSYDCPSGIVNATEAIACEKDGLQYQSGELVPSSDHCSDCYCLDGSVTCAPLECQAPGPNCVPNEIPDGSCCPSDYDCSDVSPTFGIETDYTPDLTFSSVDETTDGFAAEKATTDSEVIVTTEGYETGVTESSPSETATKVPEQESSTSVPSSVTVSPSVSELEETDSQSTPLTETTDEPGKLITDDIAPELVSTTPALEEGSCIKDQVVYTNGTDIPPSTPCEEMCACIDGVVRCELQACPPAPPAFLRCSPIDQPDQCCPSYDCPEVQPDPTSTTNCEVNGTKYTDGEYVPSSSYCTDCYCSDGNVVCATIDCEAPGENCLPIEIPEGSCCPTRYSCADGSLTIPTDDFTLSVDSLSTRITDDDLLQSDVTIPESDTRQTGEDFTTVPTVDDKTSPDEVTSATTEESATEKPGEPDVSSVTTSTLITTKEPKSTSPKEFITVTSRPSVDPSGTTISVTDTDTETESPSTATEESEAFDVTGITTKPYTEETVPEISSVTDDGSEAQPEQSTTLPSEKPEQISDETTPSAKESETTLATGVEGTTAFPSDGADCVVDEVVYSDGSSAPVTNSCQESCFCSEGAVQCEQKACPPTPPAFFKCTQVETGDCCPSYECASPSTNDTSVGCEVNGTKFSDGQYIPSDTICKDCYCIDKEVVCATIDCPIPGPNCYAIRQSEYGCCPEKYRCDLGVSSTETPPSSPATDTFEMSTRATDYTEDSDDVPTTVAPTVGCINNDKKYKDGEVVDSQNKCEDCFCSNGRVLCSALECIPPGENCTAVENSDDECCPTKYECDDQPTPSLSIPSTVPDVKYTDKPLDEGLQTRDTIQPTDATEGTILIESITTASPTDTADFTSTTRPIDETVPVTATSEAAIDDDSITTQPETETEAPYETTDAQSISEVDSVTETSVEDNLDVTKIPEQAESTGVTAPAESTGVTAPAESTGVTVPAESTGVTAPAESTGVTAPAELTGVTVPAQSTEMPDETTTDAPVTPDALEVSTDAEESTETGPGETTETPEIVTSSEMDLTECSVNGINYENGDSIPPNECQDSCTCNYGEVSCRKRACPSAPPAFLRCTLENSDGCCPTYQCPNETESSTSDLTCLKEGIEYADGEHVPSADLCSDCSCIDGRIICATLECEAPGPRCTPAPVPEGICCPEIYDCVEEMGDLAATPAPPIERETDVVDTPDSTTMPPLSSDTTNICDVNGTKYEEGDAISVQNSCQESCSCTAGEMMCVLKKCPDKPPSILRCSVIRNNTDECCPSYECPQPTETDQPSCERDGISYMEGEYVNSTNVCTDCHCIDGKIVCATLECDVPSARCTPLPPTIEECCPSYLCPGETPTETSTEMGLTTADTDDSTSPPEITTEEVIETESPAETTEISDTESLTEEATDLTTEPVVQGTTKAPTALDDVTDEMATISSADAVTESTDSAVDSIAASTEPGSETTDVPIEVITSSSVETSPEKAETETSDVSITEKPYSTEVSAIDEKDKTTDQPTDETTDIPAAEEPSSTVASAVSDDGTTDQPTAETPSQPEISPDPSPTYGLDEAVPEIKSTDTTDATTQSPSEDTQTTLSSVELVTETSTDPSAETEKQPKDVTESAIDDKLEEMSTVAPDDDVSPCQMNGTIYNDGDSMPSFRSCQHSCKCSNGTMKCERESCPPTPPQFLRCLPVPEYDENQCCPTYSCPPSAGTEGTVEATCVKDGKEFLHGEHVPSPTICTDCHCIDGVIVCAEIDCGVPGPNCSPVYQAEEACCPSTYECQETTPSYPTLPTSDDSDQETLLYTPPELEAVVVDEDETTTSLPADISDGLATTAVPEYTTFKEGETPTTKASTKPSTDSLTTYSPGETSVEDEEKLVAGLSTATDPDDLSTRVTVEQETDDQLTTLKFETLTTKTPGIVEKETVTQIPDTTSEDPIASETVKEAEHEDRTTPLLLVSTTPSSDEEQKVTDIEEIFTRITAPEGDDGEVIESTTEADESDTQGPSKATVDSGDEPTKIPSVTESTYSDTSTEVTDAFTVSVETEGDRKPEDTITEDATTSTDKYPSETQRTEKPITLVTEESTDRSTYSSVTEVEESSEKSTEAIESVSHEPDDTTSLTDDKEIESTRITDPELEPDSITSSPVTEPTEGIDTELPVSSTSAPGTPMSAIDESTSEAALTTVLASSTDAPAEVDVTEKIHDTVSDGELTYTTDISVATDSTVSSSEETSLLGVDHTKAPVLDESSRLPEESTIKSTDLTTDKSTPESFEATQPSTLIPSAPGDISESGTPSSDIETTPASAISEQDVVTQTSPDNETLSTSVEEEAVKTDQLSTESQLATETATEKHLSSTDVSSTSSPKITVSDDTPVTEVSETLIDGISNQTEKTPAIGDLSLSSDKTPTFSVVEEDSVVTPSSSFAPEDESTVPSKAIKTTVATITDSESPYATKLPEVKPTESTTGEVTTTSSVEDDKLETSSITPEQEVKVTSSEIQGETKYSTAVTEESITISPSTSTSEKVDDTDVTDDAVSTLITSPDATTDQETPVDESTARPTDDTVTKQTTLKGVTEQEVSSTDASVTTPALLVDSSITELPGDAEAPSVASDSTKGSTAFSIVETSSTTTPTDKMTDGISLPSEKPEDSLISESPSKSPPTRTPTTSEIPSPSTPVSTAHEVQETTAVTSPAPLYQTPRPGPAVTGYTSAFPPFPGGLFPSSSTTWRPNTTPDFVLGPGACMFDGKVYVSAQQILRDDPCDFCFCFRGDIICLQQSCPPPVPGCFEEPIPGFCCPRYECPLTKAIVNITTTTTPLPTYPPLQRAEEIIMCEIGDRFYHTGEIVEEASGPCLECRCGNDGMMECDPKDCPASPMLGKIFTKGRSVGSES